MTIFRDISHDDMKTMLEITNELQQLFLSDMELIEIEKELSQNLYTLNKVLEAWFELGEPPISERYLYTIFSLVEVLGSLARQAAHSSKADYLEENKLQIRIIRIRYILVGKKSIEELAQDILNKP